MVKSGMEIYRYVKKKAGLQIYLTIIGRGLFGSIKLVPATFHMGSLWKHNIWIKSWKIKWPKCNFITVTCPPDRSWNGQISTAWQQTGDMVPVGPLLCDFRTAVQLWMADIREWTVIEGWMPELVEPCMSQVLFDGRPSILWCLSSMMIHYTLWCSMYTAVHPCSSIFAYRFRKHARCLLDSLINLHELMKLIGRYRVPWKN